MNFLYVIVLKSKSGDEKHSINKINKIIAIPKNKKKRKLLKFIKIYVKI